MAQIPFGKVATYGQIAAILDHPRAARTVGWALHGIPEGLDLPWHRVVNAQGCVSITCRTHSADEQRRRLEREGVRFDAQDRIPLRAFLWDGLDLDY